MTEIDVRGNKYQVKEIKYGDWKRLLDERQEALSATDPRKSMGAIDKWVTSLTDIPLSVLDDLTLAEVEDLARKLGASQQLPLQPKENLDALSSQTQPK